jgi:hypothetical protein
MSEPIPGPLATMLARIAAALQVGPTPRDIADEHPALVKAHKENE